MVSKGKATKNKEIVNEKTKKVTERKSRKKKEEVPKILTPQKQEFLALLEQMFFDERGIGHLLFNGFFRLAMNKRLYEFTDEEMVRAFSSQLKIMQKKREREISEETKIKVCRGLLP